LKFLAIIAVAGPTPQQIIASGFLALILESWAVISLSVSRYFSSAMILIPNLFASFSMALLPESP